MRDLIKRAAAGEKEAWDSLVAQYCPLVWRFLGKFANLSRAEKQDLSQDVFVILLDKGLQSFRGSTEHEFRSYLATITKNEAIDYIQCRPRVFGPSPPDEEQKEETPPDPEDPVDRKKRLEQLRLCIQALSLIDQQIFWMRGWGYSYKEIIETLGLPLGTVAVKYSRAKVKIKECLEKAGIL